MADRDEVLDKLAHLRRRAYRPKTESGDGVATDSKLGGSPYLTDAARRPSCSACDRPMELALQLNPSQMPEPLRKQYGGELIQLFSCDGCGDTTARQLAIGGDGSPAGEPGEARVIRGWSVVDDYPAAAERAPLVELDDDEARLADALTCGGAKLSGWPAWPEAARYPKCGECGKPTRLVFQTERGWLTQCAAHKSTLAFVRAGA